MTDLEQTKYQVTWLSFVVECALLLYTRMWNGASVYTDVPPMSGTSSRNGSSIINYFRIMCVGLYRFLACMIYTKRMALFKHSRILLSVRIKMNYFDPSLIVPDVFRPLFEVTKDPQSHPELHVFLHRVVGFDTVDDESKIERRIHKKFPYPRLWNFQQSPPYSYWCLFTWYYCSSVLILNSGFIICLLIWRAWTIGVGHGDLVGLHFDGHYNNLTIFFCHLDTFVFRPHCGEAGDTDHLTSAFLTSHSISHGILLRKVPALQYLFYLKQIGMAMSPLSNNALFLTYERNPLPDFFKTGLNVSLSTDDPLQFHFTKASGFSYLAK